MYKKVGFIGAGKMAQALIHPMIESGLQPAGQISVFDVSTAVTQFVENEYEGIHMANSPQEVVEGADLVVCAVKPQNLGEEFFGQLSASPDTTLLSIIAGKPMSTFLDGGFAKVARSMPNTPAQIGKGMTVWCCTNNIPTPEREKIQKVLGSFGKQVRGFLPRKRMGQWNTTSHVSLSLSQDLRG